MGLDMTYITNIGSFTYNLTSDIGVFSKMAEKGYNDEVEAIIGVLDFGEETVIKRSDLLESVEVILNLIENQTEMLPYFYSFKMEVPKGSGKYTSGSGMATGVKIDGKIFNIEGGLDKCELVYKWQSDDGEWHQETPIDVRERKVIETDDDCFFGDIKISKKKSPSDMLSNIIKLKQFLADSNDIEVVKMLG